MMLVRQHYWAVLIALLFNPSVSSAEQTLSLPLIDLDQQPPKVYELLRCEALFRALDDDVRSHALFQQDFEVLFRNVDEVSESLVALIDDWSDSPSLRNAFSDDVRELEKMYSEMLRNAFLQSGRIDTDPIISSDIQFCLSLAGVQ